MTDENQASQQAAKRLRRDCPRWVIIWVARTGLFHAYPLFRTRRETALSAAQPGNLVTQMDAVEQAAASTPAPAHPAQATNGVGSPA